MGTCQLELPLVRRRCGHDRAYVDYSLTCGIASVYPISDSIHQIGTGYSSNNAGDGPEKTRDRKSWFPRFKSNWLGTFRSKQMFQCCECAVVPTSNNCSLSSQAGRYKGAEGKHCRCGKDQWHLAKSVEETEYNRRMEISKALGGMRYDEAVLRLRSMGQSELDFKPSEHYANAPLPHSTQNFTPSSSSSSLLASNFNMLKRTRSASSGPVSIPAPRTQVALPLMKPEQSMLSTMSPQVYGYDNSAKQYGNYNPVYSNNGIEYTHAQSAEYEHLAPAPYGDEESFGELLQGILEDDPRSATSTSMILSSSQASSYGGCSYYSSSSVAPLKRTMSMPSYTIPPVVMTTQSRDGIEPEYYVDAHRRSSLSSDQAPSYINCPHQQPQQHVLQHLPYQHQQEHQPQQHVFSRSISMAPSVATTTSTSYST